MEATEIRITDAKEFRCGNYIYVDYFGDMILPTAPSRIEKVNAYHIKDLYQGNLEWHYSAIPLTEEWLLKLGFNKVNHIHNGEIWVHKLVKITWYPNGMIELRGSVGWNKIQYVHQIQNLYHSLTGKELCN